MNLSMQENSAPNPGVQRLVVSSPYTLKFTGPGPRLMSAWRAEK